MESIFVVFSPGHLANTSAGAGYVGVGMLSACGSARDGCRDACRPMFFSEIFPAAVLWCLGILPRSLLRRRLLRWPNAATSGGLALVREVWPHAWDAATCGGLALV